MNLRSWHSPAPMGIQSALRQARAGVLCERIDGGQTWHVALAASSPGDLLQWHGPLPWKEAKALAAGLVVERAAALIVGRTVLETEEESKCGGSDVERVRRLVARSKVEGRMAS